MKSSLYPPKVCSVNRCITDGHIFFQGYWFCLYHYESLKKKWSVCSEVIHESVYEYPDKSGDLSPREDLRR